MVRRTRTQIGQIGSVKRVSTRRRRGEGMQLPYRLLMLEVTKNRLRFGVTFHHCTTSILHARPQTAGIAEANFELENYTIDIITPEIGGKR